MDVKSKLEKMEIGISIGKFEVDKDVLVADFYITNKKDKPINLQPIELHINDTVCTQEFIKKIDSLGSDNMRSLNRENINISTEKGLYMIGTFGSHFSHYQIFPFCPYLRPYEMAFGLVCIPIDKPVESINNLLLHIGVAGYNDPFEKELLISK